jgi:16S rRNA (guanine527-N7)-methyltransferase
LLPLAARFLTPNGICLFLKGATVEDELTAAERDWAFTAARFRSETSQEGVVLRISLLRRKGAIG